MPTAKMQNRFLCISNHNNVLLVTTYYSGQSDVIKLSNVAGWVPHPIPTIPKRSGMTTGRIWLNFTPVIVCVNMFSKFESGLHILNFLSVRQSDSKMFYCNPLKTMKMIARSGQTGAADDLRRSSIVSVLTLCQ